MDVRTGGRDRRTRLRGSPLLVLTLALALGGSQGQATGAPGPPADPPFPVRAMDAARPADNGSRLLTAQHGPGRVVDLTVHSAAMGRPITVEVLPAADASRPAPTLYLLNGVDGGDENGAWTESKNWFTTTDAVEFFAGKQVNVVMPVGGSASFYTDWRADDPRLGRNRWTTFLTEELPPVIDSAFTTTGVNAVAGLSMAAAAVFQLAIEAPKKFRAIASYSGCVRTSDPRGRALVTAVVLGKQGDPANMWGPPSDPLWAANDPYLRAEELRGTAIYVATGTGRPGPLDALDGPGIHGDPVKLADQIALGGMLDAVAHTCTEQLRDRLRDLNISATVDLRPSGTHSWGYWQQDLHNSWPMIEAAITE